MATGLTQLLTEMNTMNIFLGVKGGQCVGLKNLLPSCPDCLEIWRPQTPGTLWACPGLSRPVMVLLYLLLHTITSFIAQYHETTECNIFCINVWIF
jgi:hypothetical protein